MQIKLDKIKGSTWRSINFNNNILKKFKKKKGVNWELNPGPLAPKARIIPLDH